MRLYTRFRSGVTNYLDYTYTGLPIKAAMLTPTPGITISGGKATFTWSAGQGLSQYGLYIGTTGVNSFNLDYFLPLTTTTVSVTNLPKNGSTIYVRLLSRIYGTSTWLTTDYTYVAGP